MGILIVLAIAVLIIYLRIRSRRYKLSTDIALCFVGTMGSGKTLVGVRQAIKHNNARYRSYKWQRIFNRFKLLRKKKILEVPLIYSSIPINHPRYTPLEAKHLLLRTRMNQGSTIFIDEIGQLANSQDFTNENLKVDFQELVRFCRHYLGKCKLVLTDQSAENVVLYVRRRLSYIYHFSNFRKIWRIYMSDITPMLSVEDVANVVKTDASKKQYVLYGWLPFKKMYDTRCYSELYDKVPKDTELKYGVPKTLKTNNFIDLVNYPKRDNGVVEEKPSKRYYRKRTY